MSKDTPDSPGWVRDFGEPLVEWDPDLFLGATGPRGAGSTSNRVLLIGLSHDLELATIAGRLGRRGTDVRVLLLDRIESHTSWRLPAGKEAGEFDVAFCRAYRADRPVHYHANRTLKYGPVWEGIPLPERGFVADQLNTFIWAKLQGIQAARWINSPAAVRQAENKLIQLSTANEVGFEVPQTLVSSSPEEVRAFSDSIESGIVVKSLDAPVWREDETSAEFLYTAVVDTSENLDSGYPRLFQERVEAEEELRVTVVGRQMFAARVRSEDLSGGADWRQAAASHQAFEPTLVSDELRRMISELMGQFDLQIGGIDLLRSGERVHFLEVNPSAAYLWLERALETHVTDTIIQTLLVV